MPATPSFARFVFRTLLPGLIAGMLASCATKKSAATGAASTTATAKKKKESKHPAASPTPSPTPKATPAPTPTPKPTPEARYIARVSVEGGETTQEDITPDSEATPEPAPGPTPNVEAEASPPPSPSSTPTPAAEGNFLTNTWRKVFPPKPIPASETAAPEAPMLKLRPKEGMLSRMWHKVFPEKELPPAAAPPQWIGTIKLVNERDGYALIDSQGFYSVPTGETLNAVGSDSETGVLRVTTDRNPPFFIADIVSGKPRAGDRVYSPKP